MQQWRKYADIYEECMGDKGDLPHQILFDPELKKVLGDLKGKRILDLGCGNGYWLPYFAKKAKAVNGVDFSPELLRIAAKRTKHLKKVKLGFADIGKKLPFSSGRFDVVFASMVLFFLNKAALRRLFKEVARVLKKDGKFIFSVNHPLYYLIQYKVKLKDYQKYQSLKAKTLGGKAVLNYYHVPLEDYFQFALDANFELLDFKEAVITSDFARKYPRYKDVVGLPRIAVFSFEKD